jgi:SAM-dependent methyltransferase
MRRGATDPSFVAGSRGARTFPGVPEENYWFRRHRAAYGLAARAIRDTAAERILDVGCGEGYGAAMVAGAGGVVAALERDPATALHAARTYPDIGVVRADACALPCRPRSHDAVLAMQVLEHLFCADAFLRQVREVLRPEGVLLISTPNRETFSPAGEPNAFHVYEYTADELEALLRLHFDEVQMAGLHHGAMLRAADRAAGDSLQHRLMTSPFDQLPRRIQTLARSVRSRHFRVEGPTGSLDLLATARRRSR